MIKIENLHKKFNEGSANEVYALRGIDLSVKNGEFVTVIGTNGSGKSTMLNAIAGSFFPDTGRIGIDGVNMTFKKDHQRAKYISRVFQNPFQGTAPSMTVAENLQTAFLRGGRRLLRKGLNGRQYEYFHEQLKMMEMGLEDRLDSIIGTLSGGQRQAISLLMAVMQRPKVLLLDEHIAALDPKSAAQVAKLTRDFIERDKLTTLMITHSMQQALELGSRIIMMHKGRIIHNVGEEGKKYLTTQDLLNKFEEIKKAEKLSPVMIDEMAGEYF